MIRWIRKAKIAGGKHQEAIQWAKSTPSFEFTNGDIPEFAIFYDIGYNCGPLSNLCYVVYATKG